MKGAWGVDERSMRCWWRACGWSMRGEGWGNNCCHFVSREHGGWWLCVFGLPKYFWLAGLSMSSVFVWICSTLCLFWMRLCVSRLWKYVGCVGMCLECINDGLSVMDRVSCHEHFYLLFRHLWCWLHVEKLAYRHYHPDNRIMTRDWLIWYILQGEEKWTSGETENREESDWKWPEIKVQRCWWWIKVQRWWCAKSQSDGTVYVFYPRRGNLIFCPEEVFHLNVLWDKVLFFQQACHRLGVGSNRCYCQTHDWFTELLCQGMIVVDPVLCWCYSDGTLLMVQDVFCVLSQAVLVQTTWLFSRIVSV